MFTFIRTQFNRLVKWVKSFFTTTESTTAETVVEPVVTEAPVVEYPVVITPVTNKELARSFRLATRVIENQSPATNHDHMRDFTRKYFARLGYKMDLNKVQFISTLNDKRALEVGPQRPVMMEHVVEAWYSAISFHGKVKFKSIMLDLYTDDISEVITLRSNEINESYEQIFEDLAEMSEKVHGMVQEHTGRTVEELYALEAETGLSLTEIFAIEEAVTIHSVEEAEAFLGKNVFPEHPTLM